MPFGCNHFSPRSLVSRTTRVQRLGILSYMAALSGWSLSTLRNSRSFMPIKGIRSLSPFKTVSDKELNY